MSRWRGTVLTLALLGALLAAAPAGAQEAGDDGGRAEAVGDATPRDEAALLARLEEVMPLLRKAQAEFARVEAERAAAEGARRTPVDTLRVGPAMVVTPLGQAERARDVLGSVWRAEYAGWAGESAQEPGLWIAFRWSSDEDEVVVPDRTLMRVVGSRWRGRDYMEEGARDALGSVLLRTVRGTPVGSWLGGVPIRSRATPARAGGPAAVYRRLATSASQASRDCVEGSPTACAVALSLELDETPFDEWYEPEQRRLLVRRNRGLWTRNPEDRRVATACLDGDLPACDTVLSRFRARQLGGEGVAGSEPYWGAPLPNWVRASFLWHAVSRGDAGTWDRLVEAADAGLQAGPALERATGRDLEELTGSWRAWVVDQRPRRAGGAGTYTLSVLFWAALFLTLGTRSTRWRFG